MIWSLSLVEKVFLNVCYCIGRGADQVKGVNGGLRGVDPLNWSIQGCLVLSGSLSGLISIFENHEVN